MGACPLCEVKICWVLDAIFIVDCVGYEGLVKEELSPPSSFPERNEIASLPWQPPANLNHHHLFSLNGAK